MKKNLINPNPNVYVFFIEESLHAILEKNAFYCSDCCSSKINNICNKINKDYIKLDDAILIIASSLILFEEYKYYKESLNKDIYEYYYKLINDSLTDAYNTRVIDYIY